MKEYSKKNSETIAEELRKVEAKLQEAFNLVVDGPLPKAIAAILCNKIEEVGKRVGKWAKNWEEENNKTP